MQCNKGLKKRPLNMIYRKKAAILPLSAGSQLFLAFFADPIVFWGCAEKLLSFRRLDFLFKIHNFVDIFICYDIIK